jgi:hypothetical protein
MSQEHGSKVKRNPLPVSGLLSSLGVTVARLRPIAPGTRFSWA